MIVPNVMKLKQFSDIIMIIIIEQITKLVWLKNMVADATPIFREQGD